MPRRLYFLQTKYDVCGTSTGVGVQCPGTLLLVLVLLVPVLVLVLVLVLSDWREVFGLLLTGSLCGAFYY